MDKLYRCIVFSKTPLKSQFRFGDLFQILPISSSKIPTSPYATHFPLFLEYKHTGSSSKEKELGILEHAAKQKAVTDEIMNVLSVLSNHRFFTYNPSNHQWAALVPGSFFESLDQTEQDLYNNQTSSWTISGLFYPGLREDLIIESFTENKYQEAKLISPYYLYFTTDPFDDPKKEVTFPETIISSLENYFSLPHKLKQKIKSSITLIGDGIDIADYRRSLAFLSFVSAIESFMSIEYPDSDIKYDCKSCKSITDSPYSCPECGVPIWGIKTKFKEFLKRFVAGSPESMKKFNKIYNLRCKIAHHGRLFLSDYEFSLDNNPTKEEDWLIRVETLQLARMALTNWLCYPGKKIN